MTADTHPCCYRALQKKNSLLTWTERVLLTDVVAVQKSWPLDKAASVSLCRCPALCKGWQTQEEYQYMSAGRKNGKPAPSLQWYTHIYVYAAHSETFHLPQATWIHTTSTHIDEILLVSLAKVVQESSLTGVGVQKHKVLHPDPVPGYQSPFHVCISVLFHFFFLQHKGLIKQI